MLVNPADPSSLASAVNTLAESPDLRAQLGDAAREIAQKRFSRQHVLKAMRALYLPSVTDRRADY